MILRFVKENEKKNFLVLYKYYMFVCVILFKKKSIVNWGEIWWCVLLFIGDFRFFINFFFSWYKIKFWMIYMFFYLLLYLYYLIRILEILRWI